MLVLVALGWAAPADAIRINPPPSIRVNADPGRNGAVVQFASPTVSDAPQGATVACTYSSGSFFPVGLTTVFCQATEPTGNAVYTSFTITVVAAPDHQAPTFAGGHDITVTARPGAGGAAVGYGRPTASDNSGAVSAVTCAPASGTTFPIGTTTVTCAARDGAGNTAQTSFRATVLRGASSTPGAGPTQGGAGQQPGTFPGQTSLPPFGVTTVPGLCFPCVVTTTTTPTLPPLTAPPSTTPLTVSPILAGRDTTTIPVPKGATDHQPPKDGGPSTKVAAYGSLGVLAAGMVLALLARWRFDREPI